VSDIARMWPVNGKFDPEQRQLLQFVLEYRNAILKRIRPRVEVKQIMQEAKQALEPVFQRTKFAKPSYEKACRNLVERGGGVFSHPVGMAVHDDGGYSWGPLRPGHVFSIDPQLRVPEERIYMRYEDVVVVTENGVENFTDFLPSELADIEKLVGQGGLVQKFPPVSEEEMKQRSRFLGPNDDAAKVTAVPEAVIKKFDLNTAFYKKHVDYKGFSILSSARVSDAGLLEARYLIAQLLGEREDILQAMIGRGCRFMVMAATEMTTDVPEQRHLKNDPKTNWDKRARGLGGKLSSCGEENLLNLKGDRYRYENILIHEFNHAIHQQGLRVVDPTFDGRLKKAYQAAMDKELWKGTYPATNHGEYWAEGVQAYFDCMRPQFGANTREKLQKYDAALFQLVNEVYKESKFRYVRYDQRNPPGVRE